MIGHHQEPTVEDRRHASGEVDEERGTVRVTASEVMGTEVLPPILAGFQLLHPRISTELTISNRNEDVLRGDADIAVCMVRPTQSSLIAKRIGRIDVGLYGHRQYLKRQPIPQTLQDLKRHALIGYDRDLAYAQMIEKMGLPITRDQFTFRSDSEFAQLAALRAGLGIGPCQLGIARQNSDLVPVLHAELIVPMEVWLAIHPDLRSDGRVRLMFDYLAPELTCFTDGSRHER